MPLLSSIYRHARRQQALEANLTWIAPQANETLLAGQDYIAKWNATFAMEAPTFQLCMDPGDSASRNESCGASVPAPVQQDHERGFYFVSIALPNVTSSSPFNIKMHDYSIPESNSPPFFIQPLSVSGASSTNNSTNSSTDDTHVPTADSPGLSFEFPPPAPLLVPKPSSPASPFPTGPAIPQSSLLAKRDNPLEDMLPPHTPMYIIVTIVPLALVTLGLAISILLWFRQRRNGQLKRLYLTEHPMIYPRRPIMKALGSAEDIESAVQTLSKDRIRDLSEVEKGVDQGVCLGNAEGESPKLMSKFMKNRVKRREDRDSKEQQLENEETIRRFLQGGTAQHCEPDFGPSDTARQSFAPVPRNLTDSYFPPPGTAPRLGSLNLSSGTSKEMKTLTERGVVESPMSMHYQGSGGIEPPTPSVTKLSERLHLRSRSESGHSGTVLPSELERRSEESSGLEKEGEGTRGLI
ncbi:hypothetical protein DFP72DRAFT_497114 [Ephemerocybe angulata]|uniref:Uncharacterized protein n=1 Tax=Ephemerocybe angulata TaxID=980116 RepID=A0A8H6HQI4_9AGAR|nr:hypothetical protein DFP72DRAFT_497114 [Tulosesus angulatus]